MSDQTPKRLQFKFGPYVPLLRIDEKVIINPNGVVDYYCERDPLSRKLLGEILPDDSIVDAPSMILPLLLKKRTIWPVRVDEVKQHDGVNEETIAPVGGEHDDDDIQLIKIVDRSQPVKCDTSSKRLKSARDYVTKTVIQKLTANDDITLAIPDYNHSSVSNMLFSIGLSQVQEFVLEDRHRRLTSKIKRGATHLLSEIDSMKSHLMEARKNNRPFKPAQLFRCPHCSFKTELRATLDGHLENPHKINNRTFMCNWCNFKTKDSNQITYHTYVVHQKRSRIERPMPIHCCRFCDFESNSKVRYTNHIKKCEPKFDKNSVQAPDSTVDYPATTPKFITKEDIGTYESVLKDLRLAAYNPHQIEVNSHNSQNNVLLLTSGTMNLIQKTLPISLAQLSSPFTSDLTGLTAPASSAPANVPNHLHQIAHALMATGANSNNIPNNRIALLKHPKSNSVFTNGMFVVKNAENIVMAPSVANLNRKNSTATSNTETHPSTRSIRCSTNGNRSKRPVVVNIEDEEQYAHKSSNDSFVICEICDAYIEDFSEFREHMLGAHQVTIQSKPSSSCRPPLNCQRCQWRFFTDQGLERHLLGSHGLVTTSMQDKAEKQMDSGRCTICGRKFASKLVAHIKDAHKVILKPAQLSYKCKVCSATYGLYSHFENHVQQLHSDL